MHQFRTILCVIALAAVAIPTAAYTIYLRDGQRIIAREEFVIEGDKAIITLQNGTRTSLKASEIDMKRTQDANQANYGTALVLEDGKFTELPTESAPPKRESLSDLIGRGEATASSGGSARNSSASSNQDSPTMTVTGSTDLSLLPRNPYRNLEIAGEIQQFFRAQGVDSVVIYQGTQPNRLLVYIITNSEAAVFRGLKTAAEALANIRHRFPREVELFELLMTTRGREPAGQFTLTPEVASELADGRVEVSQFFVDRVAF